MTSPSSAPVTIRPSLFRLRHTTLCDGSRGASTARGSVSRILCRASTLRHLDGPAGVAAEGFDQFAGLQRPDPDGGVPGARHDLGWESGAHGGRRRVSEVALTEPRFHAVCARAYRAAVKLQTPHGPLVALQDHPTCQRVDVPHADRRVERSRHNLTTPAGCARVGFVPGA